MKFAASLFLNNLGDSDCQVAERKTQVSGQGWDTAEPRKLPDSFNRRIAFENPCGGNFRAFVSFEGREDNLEIARQLVASDCVAPPRVC